VKLRAVPEAERAFNILNESNDSDFRQGLSTEPNPEDRDMGSSDTNLTSAATLGHWIDGRAVDPEAGSRSAPVYDPATGEIAREVALASAAQGDAAVRSAAEAFPGWAATPPLRRARVMFKFKELVERNVDELARCIVAEHGKVYS